MARKSRQLDLKDLPDRGRFLRNIEIFESVPRRIIEKLASPSHERFFRAGEAVITAGEKGSSMFLLVEGKVDIFARKKGGPERRVGGLEAGHFFGEMSLLTGEPRSATVRAVTTVLAYEITKADMTAILTQHPGAAAKISRLVAERRLRSEKALLEPVRIEQKGHDEESLAEQILKGMQKFFSDIYERAGDFHEY